MRKSQFAGFSQRNVIEDGPGMLNLFSTLRIGGNDAIDDVSVIIGEFAVNLPVIHERQKSEMRIQPPGSLLHVADVGWRVERMIFVEVVNHPGSQVCVVE